jgi:hypothetical protein
MPQNTTSDVVGNSDETAGPDYAAVEITSEARSEYHYTERRAELLQLIEKAGHPAALNQTRLAERYGVSQQQISKDFDRIAEYRREQLDDRDRRALQVTATVDRAIQGLLEEGEYWKAGKLAIKRDEWATEFNDLEQLREEIAELKQRQ